MKKYINLNMILIIGLMACGAPVHGGGGKGTKIALAVGIPVVAIAGATFISEKIAEKAAADAIAEKAAADAEQQALADTMVFHFNDDLKYDPKLDPRPLELTPKEVENDINAKRERLNWEAKRRAENERPKVEKVQTNQGIKRPDINDYQVGPQYQAPDGSTFTVGKHLGNSYTKTFDDKRVEMYDKDGFLQLKIFTDGTVNRYQYGLLLETKKDNITRVYIREKEKEMMITGYNDKFTNNRKFAGKGKNGKHYGKDRKTQEEDRSGIKLTEQDRSLTAQRDKGGDKVVASEENTDNEIKDANQDNEGAANNSQNQVRVNNNPDGVSANQVNAEQPESRDGEGGYGEDVV